MGTATDGVGLLWSIVSSYDTLYLWFLLAKYFVTATVLIQMLEIPYMGL